MLDIMAENEEVSTRPDGSPPTYDDAMKYINDAFSEGDEEPPPTYSPTPNAGEQSLPSFIQNSRSGSGLTNSSLPTSPPPYSN